MILKKKRHCVHSEAIHPPDSNDDGGDDGRNDEGSGDDDIDNDNDANEGGDDRDVALQVLAAQLFELLGAFLVLAPEHLLSWSSQLLVVYKDDADEADDGDDNGDEVDNDDFQNVGTLFLNENMCWTGLINSLLLLAKNDDNHVAADAR